MRVWRGGARRGSRPEIAAERYAAGRGGEDGPGQAGPGGQRKRGRASGGVRSAGMRHRLADGWARLGWCIAWSGPLRARQPSASGVWAERVAGPDRVERGFWAEWGRMGWVVLGLGSFSNPFPFYFFSFLNLNQIKFEFKYKFEFNYTQIIKTMHQHECNIKFLNLHKF